jgi:hypothetical protein
LTSRSRAPDSQDDHERPRIRDRGVDPFGDAESATTVRSRVQPREKRKESSGSDHRPADRENDRAM